MYDIVHNVHYRLILFLSWLCYMAAATFLDTPHGKAANTNNNIAKNGITSHAISYKHTHTHTAEYKTHGKQKYEMGLFPGFREREPYSIH